LVFGLGFGLGFWCLGLGLGIGDYLWFLGLGLGIGDYLWFLVVGFGTGGLGICGLGIGDSNIVASDQMVVKIR
jgi:hypothetical protein